MRLNTRHTFSRDEGESNWEWGERRNIATVCMETEKVMAHMELCYLCCLPLGLARPLNANSQDVRCEFIWKQCTYLFLNSKVQSHHFQCQVFGLTTNLSSQLRNDVRDVRLLSILFYNLSKRKTNVRKAFIDSNSHTIRIICCVYLTQLHEWSRLEIIAWMCMSDVRA